MSDGSLEQGDPGEGAASELKITWLDADGDEAEELCTGDELAAALDAAVDEGCRLISVECQTMAVAELAARFERFADPDARASYDLNGELYDAVIASDGKPVFVPSDFEPFDLEEIEVLEYAEVEIDRPMLCGTQWEGIFRFGDVYWVEARGDLHTGRTVLGRFTDYSAAIAAAVEASAYFEITPNGTVSSSLEDE